MYVVFMYKKCIIIMASKKCIELLCLIYVGLLFTSGLLLFGSYIYLGYKLVISTHSFKFAPAECIAPVILLTILAISHCVIAKLGINGATKNILSHIVWFKLGLVVLIIAEIGIGVWAVLLYNKIDLTSTNLIINSFQRFVQNNYDKSSWESLQRELQCCGINNGTDYDLYNSTIGYSLSCVCSGCSSFYPRGCKDAIIKPLRKLLLDILLIGFGSAAFLILGVISFVIYIKQLTKKQQLDQM